MALTSTWRAKRAMTLGSWHEEWGPGPGAKHQTWLSIQEWDERWMLAYDGICNFYQFIYIFIYMFQPIECECIGIAYIDAHGI